MRMLTRRSVALASVAATAVGLVGWQATSARAVPQDQTIYVTGTGPGGGPHVKVFAQNASEAASFMAYDPAFRGGVNVALGDLNGDGRNEIITGAGSGGGPHVRVFTDHGTPLDALAFYAYDPGFTGGVNVTASDVNGDGDDEIIVAPQAQGGPHVKIYDIVSNKASKIGEFFAYDASFLGGVNLTGLDGTNGRTFAVAPGRTGGPHVRTCTLQGCDAGFFAYASNYFGGVTLTDLPNDQDDVIMTASMENSGHVRAFELNGTPVSEINFFAFPGTNNGASIAGIPDPDNPSALVVAPYRGSGPVTGRDLDGSATPLTFNPYPGFAGGIRVAARFGSFDANPVATTTTTAPTTTTTTTPSTTTSSTSTTTSTSTTSSTTSTSLLI